MYADIVLTVNKKIDSGGLEIPICHLFYSLGNKKKGGLLWKHLFLHAKPGFHGVMANKATSFGNFYRYVLFAHHFQDTLHPSEKFVVPTLAISINKHFSKKTRSIKQPS
jgi:hypothetical protein